MGTREFRASPRRTASITESSSRAVAGHLDVAARDLLHRRGGPPQTGADRATRGRGPDLRAKRRAVFDRVLVIDDVATTGATLVAAARALRQTGASVGRGGDGDAYTPTRTLVSKSGIYSPRMDVVVFGKHVEVSAELRALTREKLERINKYASDVRRIDVDYDELATKRPTDSHTCEILVHLRKHLVKGCAAAGDHISALDGALDKVEQQMRRLHDRRVHRRNGAKNQRSNGVESSLGDTAAAVSSDTEVDADGVVIVKSKQFAVKPMDVEEAALQMELLGHDFFLFTRAETGGAAVLYRRRDGTLGMIEAAG